MSRRVRDRGQCLRRAGGSKKSGAGKRSNDGKESGAGRGNSMEGEMAAGSRLENWLKKYGKRGGMRVEQKIR